VSDAPAAAGSGGLCAGRVAIVTGAARGLGRAHALELARQGAAVVVNDIGAELDGTGGSDAPAHAVVAEIEAAGGRAVVNGDDVGDWAGAERLVRTAVEAFGRLDVVVNNAGVVRDRMFASSEDAEWEVTLRVHLKGHAAVARHAAAYWRGLAKAGEAVDGRIINTSSGAGTLGSVGQSAYSAAKAGIATLTLVQAAELGRYGVTANALAPSARTRMTEKVFAETMAAPDDPDAFDAMAPENVSPLVAWLASPESAHVTGQLFEVEAGSICILEGWHRGPSADAGRRWHANELTPVIDDLLAKTRPPHPVYGAS
jgi:NAD(P)-dependent dehydrogenase (short-subunit alcohol dehydrogenase family)